MDNNIWFYTLSTSAQVLAALAGLFAVFVVWKMQDVNALLSEIREAVLKITYHAQNNTKDYEFTKPTELSQISNDDLLIKFSELRRIRENEPKRAGYSNSPIQSPNRISCYSMDDFTEMTFAEMINKKKKIEAVFRKVILVNFLTIIACIATLTFTNYIPHKEIFLPLIAAAVFYSLYKLGMGIYDAAIE